MWFIYLSYFLSCMYDVCIVYVNYNEVSYIKICFFIIFLNI